MGKMVGDIPLALHLKWCKGCNLCTTFCPRGVLALNMGKVEIQYPEKCIRCGLCQQICPDYVIYVRRDENV